MQAVSLWATRSPALAMVLAAIVVGPLAAGVLLAERGPGELVADNLPEQQALLAVQELIGDDHRVLVLVDHERQDVAATPQTARTLLRLDTVLEEAAGVLAVESLASELRTRNGTNADSPPSQVRAAMAYLRDNEPTVWARYVSGDGKANLAYLTVDGDLEPSEVIKNLRGPLATGQSFFGEAQVAATGPVYLDPDGAKASDRIPLLLALVAAGTAAIVWVVLWGRLRDAIVPLATSGGATAAGIGAVAWLWRDLSDLFLLAAPVILFLVAAGTLLFVQSAKGRDLEARWRTIQDRAGAAHLVGLSIQVLVAIVLLFSSIPLVQQWGVLLLVASLVGYLLDVLLAPAVIAAITRWLRRVAGPGALATSLSTGLGRWGEALVRRWPPVTALVVFLVAGGAALAIDFDVEPTTQEPDADAAEALGRAERRFDGLTVSYVHLEGDLESQLLAIDGYTRDLRNLTGVSRVESPTQVAIERFGDLPNNNQWRGFIAEADAEQLIVPGQAVLILHVAGSNEDGVVRAASVLLRDAGLQGTVTGGAAIGLASEKALLDDVLRSLALAAVAAPVLALLAAPLGVAVVVITVLLVSGLLVVGALAALPPAWAPTAVSMIALVGLVWPVTGTTHLGQVAWRTLRDGGSRADAIKAAMERRGTALLSVGLAAASAFAVLAVAGQEPGRLGLVAALTGFVGMVVLLLLPGLLILTGLLGAGRPIQAEQPGQAPAAGEVSRKDWMTASVACEDCRRPIHLALRGHARAPRQVHCPHCAHAQHIDAQVMFQPRRLAARQPGTAGFRCESCKTEWRVGRLADGAEPPAPGACPHCAATSGLRRAKAPLQA
ncbi:MAG: MMPL family transporter [Thermoplasmatota archaeon]